MSYEVQLSGHISRRFNLELEEARNQVMKMGGLAESQIENGLHALMNFDVELATKVIETDQQINQLEIDIDDACTKIMARRQPAASDLRLMISIIKTITDLERIGDEAIKLGKATIEIAKSENSTRQFAELRNLGERVKTMFSKALDAYARMSVEDSLQIIESDKIIDEEFDNVSRLLITRMMEDPREIKTSLMINQCAKALERIGDHSKNICEFTIYLVNGKDIRHPEDNENITVD